MHSGLIDLSPEIIASIIPLGESAAQPKTQTTKCSSAWTPYIIITMLIRIFLAVATIIL